eukprot:42645_1
MTKLIQQIAANFTSVMDDIQHIVENGYVLHQNITEKWILNYENFWLKFQEVNGNLMKQFVESKSQRILAMLLKASEKDGLKIKSWVECKKFWCEYIIDNYKKRKLENKVTTFLNQWFDEIAQSTNANGNAQSEILFSVEEGGNNAKELYPISEEKTPYAFYAIASVTAIIILIGLFAFIFNKAPSTFSKIPGFNIVDDGRWTAMIIFGLQFWDFSSDLNLCIEIWITENIFKKIQILTTDQDTNREDFIILIVAIGSAVFVIVPYVANIIVASRIKNIIKTNQTAKAWFGAYTMIFCLFVVFTGGCYAALALVSSNAFGLKVLSSGLTLYELKSLTNIKIFGSVVLENVPQLMLQLLYASERGITQSVAIAFVASMLSVVATLLGYLIERNGNEVKHVEYYLTIQCKRCNPPLEQTLNVNVSHRTLAIDQNVPSIVSPGSDMSPSGYGNKLTDQETENIMNNRGRTEALSEGLAALFQTQPKNIEVGSTLVHSYGAIIHVVHMVDQSEVDIMRQELDDDEIIVNPYFYTQQLFSSLKNEITGLFRIHFKLGQDCFVEYDDFVGLNKRKITKGMTMDRDKPPINVSTRKLLRKVATEAKLKIRGNGLQKTSVQEVTSVLKQYFDDNKIEDVKRVEILKIVDSLNEKKSNDYGDSSIKYLPDIEGDNVIELTSMPPHNRTIDDLNDMLGDILEAQKSIPL